jgi:toxin ParE1/3/4
VRLVWSSLALNRIAAIADEIAGDRPQAADAWMDTILAAAERLTAFPQSGRVVPELRRDDVREVIEGPYRIIYRVEQNQLSVLTVRHSRQLTGPADLPDA